MPGFPSSPPPNSEYESLSLIIRLPEFLLYNGANFASSSFHPNFAIMYAGSPARHLAFPSGACRQLKADC